MGVDQAGHDPLPAGVDHADVAAILELQLGRQRADALDPGALDDDGVVVAGRLARSVDQGAVADHQGLRAAGAHGCRLAALGIARRYSQTGRRVNNCTHAQIR